MKPDGDRSRPAGALRVARVQLFDLNQKRVAEVTLVSDDKLPAVIMFKGDPFLRAELRVHRFDAVAYDQAIAYRADDSLAVEVSA